MHTRSRKATNLPELVRDTNTDCLLEVVVCSTAQPLKTQRVHTLQSRICIHTYTPPPPDTLSGPYDTHAVSQSPSARCTIVCEHSWAHQRGWQWDSCECEAAFVLHASNENLYGIQKWFLNPGALFASTWKSCKSCKSSAQRRWWTSIYSLHVKALHKGRHSWQMYE